MTDLSSSARRPPWEQRLSAFLAIKLGKRPGNATLEYMAQWAPTEGLRYEAARLLVKRKVRREADLLRAGVGVGREGQGGEAVD